MPSWSSAASRAPFWIQNNLQEKDLLFVGFWTDWAYLNQAISETFSTTHPRSITLVDPAELDELQAKASVLWELAHQDGVTFTHVKENGDVFLAELRKAFSQAYMRELLRSGGDALARIRPGVVVLPEWQTVPDMSNDQLYSWRRDAEGKTPVEPAQLVVPQLTAEAVAFLHVLLQSKGWTPADTSYRKENTSVRVLNVAGRFLEDTKRSFSEAPSVIEAAVVVCVGATNIGVPFDLVRDSDPADVIRGGSTARWITLEAAIAEFQL